MASALNPQVDRLTQSAIMEIDKHGRVVNYTITQTVIKTSFRMTYSDVNDILAGDEEKRKNIIKLYQVSNSWPSFMKL